MKCRWKCGRCANLVVRLQSRMEPYQSVVRFYNRYATRICFVCEICKPCCSFQSRMDLYTLRCLTLWNPISQLFACTSQSRMEPYQFSCSHATEIGRFSTKIAIIDGRSKYFKKSYNFAWEGRTSMSPRCSEMHTFFEKCRTSHLKS